MKVTFTVPGIPPSGNHYRGFNRRQGRFYVRPAAVGFKSDLAMSWRMSGQVLPEAKSYHCEAIIYLPKGKRGDADNFNKVLWDAVQAAGIFKNDSRAKRVEIQVERDWKNPRTEITIEPLTQTR